MQDSHDSHRAFLGTAFNVCKERDPRARGLFKRCKNGYRLLLSVRLKDGQNCRGALHCGYVTREEYEVQFAEISDQITAYAQGTPINVVNPEVLQAVPEHRLSRTS